jgi:ABC-type branched-subunit amino acid transport system ATPase component/ABC-type branched-subunit amino acid transport system permease subunit
VSGVAAEVREAWADARAGWRPAWTVAAGVVGALALTPLVAGGSQLELLAAGGYLALAAVGLNVAAGMAGIPLLCQGAFVGLGAFGAAWLEARHGWSPGPAIVAGVAVSGAAGAAIGVAARRMRPAFTAVATWIATWLLAFLLAAFPGLFGGSQGLVVPGSPLRVPVLGSTVRLTSGVHFELALWLLAAALVGFAAARRSSLGVAMAAVRAGVAEEAGVEPGRHRVGALVVAALLGGLAGALGVHLAGVADRAAYGPVLSVELFVAVLLGGEGTVLGPVLGTIAVVAIPGAARGLGSASGIGPERYAPVIASALLLAAIALRARRGHPRLGGRTGDGAAPEPATAVVDDDVLRPERPRRLAGEALSRRFGGVVAADGVTFEAEPGTIHALVGPNGSGKSTLLAMLGGSLAPDSGRVVLDGRNVTARGAAARVRAGVARTLQRTTVVGALPALDHVEAGTLAARRFAGAVRSALATPRARRERAEARRHAVTLLRLVGLEHRDGVPAERLDGAEQRLLAVATACASRPSVVLLDEPAAGLAPAEADRLTGLLRRLRDAGVAVVLVEHDFPLVMEVADRVTVLDAGRVIASGPPAAVAADPAVVDAYLGAGVG